jgi:hypothetical protein
VSSSWPCKLNSVPVQFMPKGLIQPSVKLKQSCVQKKGWLQTRQSLLLFTTSII